MKSLLPKVLCLLLITSAGCTQRRIKRLTNDEYNHYYALKVWMTDEERDTFLKRKIEEDRNAFLQELGLWDRFYRYSELERSEIIEGEVEVGWTKDKVLMAWGRPHDSQKLVGRQARRSERLIYRFELHEGGRVLVWDANSNTDYQAQRLFQRDLILDDDLVVDIVLKRSWD